MQVLGLLSALAAIGTGSWVALRLLALARRTGEPPERWVGAGLLLFAGFAYPLLLVVSAGAETFSPGVLYPMTAAACCARRCVASSWARPARARC